MSLKNILKQIKQHESAISTIMGFVIIVIIGLLVVNYFRNLDSEGEITDIADNSVESTEEIHIIAEGESLWTIAEQYYDDGFKWVEIMEANNIDNPGDIEVGQELIVPNVDSNVIADAGNPTEANTPEPTVDATSTPEVTEEPTVEPTATPEVTVEATATPTPTVIATDSENEEVSAPVTAEDGTYIVARGDNLWDIAVEVYGNGYRWVDIAEANDLVNPGIIHAGNVLEIPA